MAPMSASLLLALALGPWQPESEPQVTAWGKMGGRGWTVCQDLARQAAAMEEGTPHDTDRRDAWREGVKKCPNVPMLLQVAAEAEAYQTVRLLRGVDRGTPIKAVVVAHKKGFERALAWLESGLAEAERRGQEPPARTRFVQGVVLLGLGRPDQARRALEEVARHREVPSWRTDRLLALADLFSGELEVALRRAHRAMVEGPNEERLVSLYILALVLDRAGASATAGSVIRTLYRGPRGDMARASVEVALPIHERLYFKALAYQANGEAKRARQLWRAYLARPEPEAPERELAERHRREVAGTPPPVAD